MKFQRTLIAASVLALGVTGSALAQEKTLRLLTWADFTRGVYGGRVYWAKWQIQPVPAKERPHGPA